MCDGDRIESTGCIALAPPCHPLLEHQLAIAAREYQARAQRSIHQPATTAEVVAGLKNPKQFGVDPLDLAANDKQVKIFRRLFSEINSEMQKTLQKNEEVTETCCWYLKYEPNRYSLN